MRYSSEYIQLLNRGPFPGQTDPWAESGRYFRQIQADMLLSFLSQHQSILLAMGYTAGLDWTLQSGEHTNAHKDILPKLNMVVEVSIPDLKALHIRQISSGNIVTIIEIISPYSKIDNTSMQAYIQLRNQRMDENGTQFVEIDLTRTENRIENLLRNPHSYNVTVHLKDDYHVIFMDYGKSLPRIALPLHSEVIAVELQTVYDLAYQQASVAAQMLNNDFYSEENLPFPSLLTDTQIHEATETVTRWREELKRLQSSSS